MIQPPDPATLDLGIVSFLEAIRRLAVRILEVPETSEVRHFRRDGQFADRQGDFGNACGELRLSVCAWWPTRRTESRFPGCATAPSASGFRPSQSACETKSPQSER